MPVVASILSAAPFGKVIPIGGHVSDIALDKRRSVLYIANFGSNRLEVMSTLDYSLQAPIAVPAQPAALDLSPDGRYLVVGHYATWSDGTLKPSVTILDLDGGVRQGIALANSPLAIAFGIGNKALVVTKADIQLLDPTNGTLQILTTFPALLKTENLPVEYPKFPPEILQASTGLSGDGQVIYVLAQGADLAAVIRYRVLDQAVQVVGIKASPELGPRVISTNADGSVILAGWGLLTPDFVLLAQFPYPTGKLQTGSHAYDYARGLIYAQIPSSLGGGPGTPSPLPPLVPTTPGEPPTLTIAAVDNLTVEERLQLRENLAGKSLFSPDMKTLYAISDSGVTILPIGELDQTPRVIAQEEDVIFRGNNCDLKPITRAITLVDPGGGRTDFTITGAPRGVTIAPASGTTPTQAFVTVDPSVFQNQKGSVAITLEIRSASAVNVPPPVRLLINTREPEQRGQIVNVPGKLVDLLADPIRDRFYVLRQDKNVVLVFDGTTFNQVGALRTGNTPTQMAMTNDRRHLIVGNDNSQIANVYDLDALLPAGPIIFPPGHYPRSIAVTSRTMMAAVRNVASGDHKIDRIHFESRFANELPSLGIYKNGINVDTGLFASPTGNLLLAAMPDGNLLLYEASADTFIAARKDLTAATGPVSIVYDQFFVVENNLLNSSLVPIGKMETDSGASSGFAFVDDLGLRTTSASAAAPGLIQRVDLTTLRSIRPTRMAEAPILVKDIKTPAVGQIGQTIPSFARTLAPLANRQYIVSLSTSGLVVLPWDFDAAVAPPVIESVVNAINESPQVAPGALIHIYGAYLSLMTFTSSEVPAPTVLGDACLTVNGTLIPLFLVSPSQIRAQLPYDIVGGAKMILRGPGGTSPAFDFTVLPAAPAILRTGTAGPLTGLPTVYRAKNNELVTISNPIHPEDVIIIVLTGLGATSPPIPPGVPAPAEPPLSTLGTPEVILAGESLGLLFSGMVPGQIGIYQILARVPWWIATGYSQPLTVRLGGQSTTLSVRIVK